MRGEDITAVRSAGRITGEHKGRRKRMGYPLYDESQPIRRSLEDPGVAQAT